jgi:predicted O-methyltransferase YrrM
VVMNTDHDGWFNFSKFYDFVVENNPNFRKFVEVGVWTGRSIAYLAKITPDDAFIQAVDLWEDTYKPHLQTLVSDIYFAYNKYLVEQGVRNKIFDYQCFSWDAPKYFKNKSIDFVFIDADHQYESVKKDIEKWLPKIKKGGIISGHDYREPSEDNGVKTAVDELIPDRELFGEVWWKKI